MLDTPVLVKSPKLRVVGTWMSDHLGNHVVIEYIYRYIHRTQLLSAYIDDFVSVTRASDLN
jgi:hypothetical protein